MATVHIRGMKCQHCVGSVKRVLESLGLSQVQIDLTKGEASYEGTVDPEKMRQAVAAQGFEVVV